jgi:asparagine synthase (glutamine-hydrolysing)
MCGIVFIVGVLHSEAWEQTHFPKLQPRGPDGSKFLVKDNFCYGFHRLAIINISDSGMQPFVKDNMTLICNGEIYNYKEFTNTRVKSDVEVILELDWNNPEEFISKLDGDFAFVLTKGDNYLVARDHVGVRPLFYGINSDRIPIAFSSEAKVLYGAPEIIEIKVFPPATLYNSLTKSWTPIPFQKTMEIENCQKNIREYLEKAVVKRLEHSDRPVGILCSGGVDSAILTSLVARHTTPSRFHVFTMEYNVGLSEDSIYAKMLCSSLGFNHTVVKFNEEDIKNNIESVIKIIESYDPNTIRASIPMYLLAKYIKENTDIKVILSGEGADELFAGYNYFNLVDSSEKLQDETKRLIKNIHQFDLLRADRCFASQGLEVRVPFLDKDFINAVFNIDGKEKTFVNGGEKSLLRDSFREMLPELVRFRILDRPKERFSDGCGLNYVPTLLRYIGEGARSLKEQLQKEKAFDKKIFTDNYGENYHWILTRELPSWAQKEGDVKNISMN